LGQEKVRLEDKTNLPVPHGRQLPVIELVKVLSPEGNLAGRRAVERADNIQQRAFARPGRPDDCQ